MTVKEAEIVSREIGGRKKLGCPIRQPAVEDYVVDVVLEEVEEEELPGDGSPIGSLEYDTEEKVVVDHHVQEEYLATGR